MGTGARLFFLDSEDRIHRISVSKFNRFYLQHDENESFLEFAGQRVRDAHVLVELEGRKPVGVKHVSYGIIVFNNEGKLDEEVHSKVMRLAANVLSIYSPNKENVIDASGKFAQKQFQNEFSWKPTPEIERALARAIFDIKDDEGPKGKSRSLRLV